MRDECAPVWAPPEYCSDTYVTNWEKWADEAEFPKSVYNKKWLPSLADFLQAIKKTHGAAGFDGWEAKELRVLLKIAPDLITELHQLWCDTSKNAASSQPQLSKELLSLLFSWRTVGIRKKTKTSRDQSEWHPAYFDLGSQPWLSPSLRSLRDNGRAKNGRVSCTQSQTGLPPPAMKVPKWICPRHTTT